MEGRSGGGFAVAVLVPLGGGAVEVDVGHWLGLGVRFAWAVEEEWTLFSVFFQSIS